LVAYVDYFTKALTLLCVLCVLWSIDEVAKAKYRHDIAIFFKYSHSKNILLDKI